MKSNIKAKNTPAQQMLLLVDKKIAPNVANMAIIPMLAGVLSLFLSSVFGTYNLFETSIPKLCVLGYILISMSVSLIYGAKLQRIHYRLDK